MVPKKLQGQAENRAGAETSSTPFEGWAPGTLSNGRRRVPGAVGGEPVHFMEYACVMD